MDDQSDDRLDDLAEERLSRTIHDRNDPALTLLDDFSNPQSAAQIAEQKRKDAQALINSTNQLYDTKVSAESTAGQDRLAKNNAISVLSGLSGSTEAVRTDNEVSGANKKAMDAIAAERAVALQTIYGKINDDALAEAQKQKEDATAQAKDIVARRKETTQQLQDNLKLIAAGGESFDTFKQNATPDAYQHAVDAYGSEDALKASFAVDTIARRASLSAHPRASGTNTSRHTKIL